MDINEITFGQAREIAKAFGASTAGTIGALTGGVVGRQIGAKVEQTEQAVVVCTDKRGVFFGYTTDPLADPINLRAARMCIYWSSKTGGVAGLATTGPTDAVSKGTGSRIAAESDAILRGITAVFPASTDAAKAWAAAPVFKDA